MSIDAAIALLQAEIDLLGQGTKQQPKEGTTAWFELRAKNLGMTYLRRLKQLSIHGDPTAAERFHIACDKVFKLTEPPAAPQIIKETLPDGSPPRSSI